MGNGKVKAIVGILLLLSVGGFCMYQKVSFKSEFERFINTYSVSYRTPEEKRIRSFVFNQNLVLIREHNDQHPEVSLKMNRFGDLSLDEFERLYMAQIDDAEFPVYEKVEGGEEREVDWMGKEEKGLVEVVQQQYTSSVPLAIIQSLNFHSPRPLSVQQLLDCHGWHSTFAGYYSYIEAFGGVMAEEDYMTTGYPRGVCGADPSRVAFKVKGHRDVPYGDQEELKKAVSQGPVVVGIDSKSLIMQFYSSGVIESDCEHYINTAGLLVGFGEEDGHEYWRVLTSFGKDWGEEGYVRIGIGEEETGVCGIATSMAYPVV